MIAAKILIFLTFVFVPFLGGNHLALFYINIDRFWFDALFGILLVLSVMVLHLSGNRRQSDFVRFCRYFLPFLAINVLSLLYSWNKFGTLVSISVLVWAIGCVYLFLVCPWKEVCLLGLVAGGTGSAVSAILQHFILFPNIASVFQQGMYAHILREQSAIPFSSYLHHNMLGGYLAFVLPLAIYFVLQKKGIISTLCATASALIITGVVLSSSRIGLGIVLLGLAAGFMVSVIFRKPKAGAVRLCAIAALAVIISWAVLHGGGNERGPGLQSVIAQKTKMVYKHASTLNTRTEIWRNALDAFRSRPVVGFGAGAFEYGYRKYFDGGSYTIAAHSTVVKTAVELGIIGLLCFLIYLFGVGVGVAHQKGSLKGFLLICAASGFFFGLIDFSFDVTSHVITFFVITSIFFAKENSEANDSKNSGDFRGFGLFIMMIICLMGAFLFCTKDYLSKRSIESGDVLLENGFPVKALYAYREAMKSMPFNPDAYLKATSVLARVVPTQENSRDRELMLSELKEYLYTMERMNDKNSERFFGMGQGFAVVGDRKKADSWFREALNYYPSSPYYTYEIAVYYFSSGQADKAVSRIRAFDQYIPKFRTRHNPRGIFVYKIRDLEASIEYSKGNKERALEIARQNLEDAEAGIYVITSTRSRNYVPQEVFLEYLRERVHFFEGKSGKEDLKSSPKIEVSARTDS